MKITSGTPLRVFDSNCILGQGRGDAGVSLYTAADALAHMDSHGIAKSLVRGAIARAGDAMLGNDILLREVGDSGRLVPCAVALPHHTGEFPPPEEFAAYLARYNIRAVGIYPRLFDIQLYPWVWDGLFAALAARRLPLFLDFTVQHWSEDIDWAAVDKICGAFPALPLILVRMGNKSDRYLYPLMEIHQNLHMETSYYTVNNGIGALCARFGPDRLLYGSGSPVYNPNASLATLYLADITPAQRQKIAGENLERLLEGVRFRA